MNSSTYARPDGRFTPWTGDAQPRDLDA